MKIKVDCKFLAGKFAEDVCLAHSKGKEVEKCPFCRYEGEYKNCDKYFEKLDCYKYNLATMKITEMEKEK